MNEFTDDQRKHIDIIESTITRMSENSKQMKEWCIALVTGLVGISITAKIPSLCFIAVLVVGVFGYLDVFYLQLERCFRRLYNDAVGIGNDGLPAINVPLYSTSIKGYKIQEQLITVWKSPSIRPFYIGLLVGVFFLGGFSFCIEKNVDEEKIELTNEQISLQFAKPLDIRLRELDSLILKIDELKKVNVQILDTVKTKTLVKKGK